MKTELNIGDLVNDPTSLRLYCGSGAYPHAVVMSVEPFILVSEGTDMLWTKLARKGFVKVGRASKVTILRCMTRLTWPQRRKLLGLGFSKKDIAGDIVHTKLRVPLGSTIRILECNHEDSKGKCWLELRNEEGNIQQADLTPKQVREMIQGFQDYLAYKPKKKRGAHGEA